VTDAGTPGISDPGSELIRTCWERGIAVDSIPGPSAPLAAAVASGFHLDPLTIFGFAPARAKDRKVWFSRLRGVGETFTFFEAPHRIDRTLSEVSEYFGNRPIMIARELTKKHQQLIRADKASLIGQMPVARGEFTFVVGPAPAEATKTSGYVESDIYNEFCLMTSVAGTTRRSAVAELARKYGRTTNNIYDLIERMKTGV
jgi:16S rRNA (cytidine1402-2'-O)-methyltransferase